MNVVMVTPSCFGGHARYTAELVGAIRTQMLESGGEVAILTSRDERSTYDVVANVVIGLLPRMADRGEYNGKFSWIAGRLFHYFVREILLQAALLFGAARHFTVVHFQETNLLATPVTLLLCRLFGKRTVITVHNIKPHSYPPIFGQRSHDWLAGLTWRLADRLIVHTEGLKSQLGEIVPSLRSRIFVVPHGVWDAAARKMSDEAFDAATDPRKLLFFGVVRRNKGLKVLLEAMKELPEYRLRVVGIAEDEDYRAELMQLIDALPHRNVDASFEFVDDERADLEFRDSGMVILPYTEFGAQSGVLWLAVANERPVLVTNVGALGETVNESRIGGVVAPNSVDAIKVGILRLSEPENYAAAKKACVDMRRNGSWENSAMKSVEIYKNMVWRR